MVIAVMNVEKKLKSKGVTLLKYWSYYNEFYFKISMDNKIFFVMSKPRHYTSKSGFVLSVVKNINSKWVECGEFNSRINEELEYVSRATLRKKEYKKEARISKSSYYSEDNDWWCDLDIFH